MLWDKNIFQKTSTSKTSSHGWKIQSLRSYSQYALFHHDDNVGYEDDLNNRLIQRIYCLLSGKSHIIYERLFQLIIDKVNYWEQSMLDFEYSTFNSLAVKFPNVLRRGCYFHYCQAIFRRIQRNMKVSDFFLSNIHLSVNSNVHLLIRLHIAIWTLVYEWWLKRYLPSQFWNKIERIGRSWMEKNQICAKSLLFCQ